MRLLEAAPTVAECWDWTAAYFERNGRLREAEQTLRLARDRLPRTRAAFTDSLALILHRLGRTGEAQRALAEFLSATAAADDPELLRRRERAAAILAGLFRSPGKQPPNG